MYSEYDLFNLSLKVIRTIQREFGSRRFAVVGPAHWVAQKQPLQFAHHLGRWGVAAQDVQHVRFQRMKRVGPIDWLRIRALRTMVVRIWLAGRVNTLSRLPSKTAA